MELDSEKRRIGADFIIKAYEHHKTHARFEESQRALMLAAYVTFTGFVYVGLFGKMLSSSDSANSSLPDGLWFIALLSHFVVGILVLLAVSKASGEFRRHFDRAEMILTDIKTLCESDEFLNSAFRHVLLQTASIKETGGGKRIDLMLLSVAFIHTYLFAFLTSIDVYLSLVFLFDYKLLSLSPIVVSIVWFILVCWSQHLLITRVERSGV